MLSVWNTVKGHGDVYYDSVTMFAFLLLAARHLDTRLKARFDLSSALLAALPDTALVETGTDRVATPLDAVPIGTRVWVPAGAQVPLDGHVVSDVAELDESALSGESAAVKRAADSAIHAGALNVGPGFAMTTSAPREKSRMASIAALAALGMTASSTLVLLNASRLLQSSHYPQPFDRTARGVVTPSAL